jgi:Gamma-glutamyltransferase
LGVAPTGATVDFFKSKGFSFPPEYGPLAAVTPGTVGGLCLMLAKYGTMSLKEVLAPAMQLASGYPIEAQTANSMERGKKMIKEWPYSAKVFLPHAGQTREAPEAGEIFVQKDLLATLTKLVEAEQNALKKKMSREQSIMAANDVFIKEILQKKLFVATMNRVGCLPCRILLNGKLLRKSRCIQITKALKFINCSNGRRDPCYCSR